MVIITATDLTNPGFVRYKKTLEHFGWPYVVLQPEYKHYGSKIVAALEYIKKNKDNLDWVVISDGYDVIVQREFSSFENFIEIACCAPGRDYSYPYPIIFNAEKGCWPNSNLAERYPKKVSRYVWKYLNGGLIFCLSAEELIKFLEFADIKEHQNDQEIFSNLFVDEYIRNLYQLDLDYDCEMFQPIAFKEPYEFGFSTYRGNHLHNRKTNSIPFFIHANGKTEGLDELVDFIFNYTAPKEYYNVELKTLDNWPDAV